MLIGWESETLFSVATLEEIMHLKCFFPSRFSFRGELAFLSFLIHTQKFKKEEGRLKLSS